MGFIEDVEWVLDQIPDERQLALFSATMPSAIHRLARKYLQNPVEIKIDAKQLTADNVRQRWWLVRGFDKRTALVRLLEGEDTDGVLVFVRTKSDTVKVSDFLANKGLQSVPLNGDMPQNQREQTIERLRNGKLDIVVATDVAARGLDVQRISHVINYDIPFDSESYVHRIGRTGRAGRSGDAILFVNRSEMHLLRNLQQHAGNQFETLELPDAEAINQKRVQRFESQITRSLEKDIEFYKYMVMEYVRENDVELEEVAGALAYMAQGGKSFLLPPDPAEVSEPVEKALLSKGNRKKTIATREDRETLDKGLVTFRIEVGRRHGANPSQIVGAIANEGQIHSRKIGRIKIFTDFSLVDLPQSQENELMRALSNTEVSGQALNLRRDTGGGGSSSNYSAGFKDSSSGYRDSGSGSGYNKDKTGRPPRRSKLPPISKGTGSKFSSYNSSKPFAGNKKPKKQHRKGF
jgi:ATP-dependent RNA helicase DeaD